MKEIKDRIGLILIIIGVSLILIGWMGMMIGVSIIIK